MSTSRDKILGRLSDSGSERGSVVVESTFASEDLWPAFETQLASLGGRIIDKDELQAILRDACFVEEAAAAVLQKEGLSLPDAGEMWDVRFGVSLAELAVAEMGSLVVSAGPGRQRMSSLVPPVNVMLISRNAIVGPLSAAIPKISDRSSAIITGPSRTADIEGILVRGVHGPGELLVYVYD